MMTPTPSRSRPGARTAACALALVLLPAAALSQTSAPGLWEQTLKMNSGSPEMSQAVAEMQKQLAAMPPAQRRQMEQMLAAQGIGLPQAGGGGGTITSRFCLTPEMAQKQELPPPGDGCTHRITKKSATAMSMSFECPADKTRGEGEFRFGGPKAYEGRFKVQREEDGKPQKVDMTMSARWLGADCGNLQPQR